MRRILLSRMVAAAVAIVGLLIAWVLDAGRPIGYPLVLIEQGVTAVQIGNQDVFAIRDGAVLEILGRSTPEGERIVYCPNEAFFVAPGDGSLFTRAGAWVAGPSSRNMDRHPVTIKPETLQVFLAEREQRARSSGATVDGEAGEAYRSWRSAPDEAQAFCQNPVG